MIREALFPCLAGVLLLFLLKSWKSELSPLIRSAILLSLFSFALVRASPLFSFVLTLADRYGLGTELSLLLRGAGIALAASLAAGLCREAGEGGIADGLEFFGKVELLLLSLPVLAELLSLAGDLLDAGGIA